MHADGELLADEERELAAFISKHPQLKKEMDVYDLTRLKPDTTQVFADKNSLLKSVPAKRIIAFPQWRKYSIAAGVAVIVFISLFKYLDNRKDTPRLTKVDSVSSQVVSPVVANNTIDQKRGNAVEKQDTPNSKPVFSASPKVAVVPKINKVPAKHVEIQREQMPVHDVATIDDMPLLRIKQLPCGTQRVEISAVRDVPVYVMQNNEEEVKRTLWDKLPIDDLKKKQLENIAGAAADIYEDISAAKQNLYDRSISIDVKLEKRKLVISF